MPRPKTCQCAKTGPLQPCSTKIDTLVVVLSTLRYKIYNLVVLLFTLRYLVPPCDTLCDLRCLVRPNTVNITDQTSADLVDLFW